MRRLHWPQQGLSKRFFPTTTHRHVSRRLLSLQSNPNELGRPREDGIHHRKGNLLLQGHALWLKNAGATYQRLVNKMFADYLGNIIEVYINGMLIKSLHAKQHVDHLRQAFEVLQKYNMKLNPTKGSFGVVSGKFLDYMVAQRGIEANPD